MTKCKNIALVAHDNKKSELVEWCEWNSSKLLAHNLFCTGTTGRLIEEALISKIRATINPDMNDNLSNMVKLKSGPLGGDQQIGAMIADGQLDMLVFFWDALASQPHDSDVKALLRIATLYNIPSACNRATADFLIESRLYLEEYTPKQYDFTAHTTRKIDI